VTPPISNASGNLAPLSKKRDATTYVPIQFISALPVVRPNHSSRNDATSPDSPHLPQEPLVSKTFYEGADVRDD
ncbi:MAG: hypothetical protein AAFP69_22960, partial [Planctomycetota bacterium]